MTGLDPVKVAQVGFLTAGGFTQTEIAERLGTSQQTVSRYASFIRGAVAPCITPEGS